MTKINTNFLRIIHRDIAYFYLGLIIAFSISGIALNHRVNFNPQEYTVKVEAIELQLPADVTALTDDFFKQATKPFIDEELRSVRHRGNEIKLYFKDAFATINSKTGKGEIEFVETIPVLGQMTILHKTTNVWWIWFSDIFGVAMLTIAITGMLMTKGKNGFADRGWKFATVGLIFPFIFLFLIR
jgi:hypothetical protein